MKSETFVNILMTLMAILGGTAIAVPGIISFSQGDALTGLVLMGLGAAAYLFLVYGIWWAE